MEYYFQGIWRMDWGLGNPNKTAALIATLLVAVWGLCAIQRFGFWIALILFTGLGVCEIHTFSRGGTLAAAVGLSLLIWRIPRPWPRQQMIAVIMSVWVMTGITIYLQAHERLCKGIVQEDRSISNRIVIWKDAPKMMVDAPRGWGLGNSGSAYVQWYQEFGRSEVYRTLVNSHKITKEKNGKSDEISGVNSICSLFVGISRCCLCLANSAGR